MSLCFPVSEAIAYLKKKTEYFLKIMEKIQSILFQLHLGNDWTVLAETLILKLRQILYIKTVRLNA